jgi:colanic acid biosynthesis glycosyl transferase WcaI
MKILLYSQFCTPEPVFKSVPFARELKRRGHDVRILTGFPNYPGGHLYPGYPLRWRQRETIDGIPILRVPLYPSHNPSVLHRGLNYASFMAASALPLLAGWRPDVVYVYNLVTLGFLTSLNSTFRGVPYILDIQDLWPDSVFQSGMGRPWMRALIDRLCRRAYSHAARVVALSPGMVETLASRGVPRARLQCIYNWCDEQGLALGDQPAPAGAPPPGFEGRFNVVYAGNLGLVQALDAVVEAAALAAQTNPAIQFVFMGKGVAQEALQAQASRVAPQNTLFLANRPLAEASAVMAHADALLIHLQPKPLFEFTIPSKTQAYLATGRPVLAAVGHDASQLVERARAGFGCTPGNPAAIADAALRLAALPPAERTDMGRRGREFYRRELSLQVGVNHWERVFAEAVAQPSI